MEERLPNMDRWGLHPHGRYLLDIERHYLDEALPKFFGYHLLQVGGPVSEPYLDSSLINHHIRLDNVERNDFEGSAVNSLYDELPFSPDSIDVAVLPHVLEYLQSPADFLAEIYNCMIGEGYVLVIGFNPYSSWGLTKLWRGDDVVWRRGKMHSLTRVKRWLRGVGFEITAQKRLGFRWPLRSQKAMQRTTFLEPMGELCWRCTGCVYVVIARKQVVTPIPLPSEAELARVPVGAIEPSG